MTHKSDRCGADDQSVSKLYSALAVSQELAGVLARAQAESARIYGLGGVADKITRQAKGVARAAAGRLQREAPSQFLKMPVGDGVRQAMSRISDFGARSKLDTAGIVGLALPIKAALPKFESAAKLTFPKAAPAFAFKQYADLASGLAKALKSFWPANMKTLSAEEYIEALSLEREEGMPLAWVASPDLVAELLRAPDKESRKAILLARRALVLTRCRELVDEAIEGGTDPEHAEFVAQSVAAFEAGHSAPAQALASNTIDTMLRAYVEKSAFAQLTGYNKLEVKVQDLPIGVGFVIVEIMGTYKTYTAASQPPLEDFSRHASSHGVSAVQYTDANALIAVMHAVSLLYVSMDRLVSLSAVVQSLAAA